MVFPIVMYRCESWTIKKAEHQRIYASELWYWRRLLRVPWTARRSNQSILKEISPEYSLEGLMLKLKLQYFSHLTWTAAPLEKTLMLGKIWRQEKGTTGDEVVGWHHWLTGHESEQAPWRTGKPGVLQSTGSRTVRHNWATEHQQNWLTFAKFAKPFVTTNMALRPLLGSYKEAHAQEKAWTEALLASWRICLFNLSMVSGILWSYFLGTETFSLFIHLTEILGILVIYAGTKILWKSRQRKRTKWLKHAPLKKEPIIYL